MRDDTNISVIVIYSFAFLFIVFLFLQQASIIKEQTPTGSAVFDTILESNIFSSEIFNTLENIPLTTLMIIGGGIVVLVLAFIIFKRLRRKKKAESQALQQTLN